MDVLSKSRSFQEKMKHTHILGPEFPVVSWDPSPQSLVSQSSVRYLLILSLPVGSLQTNLLEWTYIVLSHFPSNPEYWVSVLIE